MRLISSHYSTDRLRRTASLWLNPMRLLSCMPLCSWLSFIFMTFYAKALFALRGYGRLSGWGLLPWMSDVPYIVWAFSGTIAGLREWARMVLMQLISLGWWELLSLIGCLLAAEVHMDLFLTLFSEAKLYYEKPTSGPLVFEANITDLLAWFAGC